MEIQRKHAIYCACIYKLLYYIKSWRRKGLSCGTIGIGSPPQYFKIFFDTVHAGTWIPSTLCDKNKFPACRQHHRYNRSASSTSTPTEEIFHVNAFGGVINGTLTKDTITLDGVTLKNHIFGEGVHMDGDHLLRAPFDGVIGLGFGLPERKYSTLLESLRENGLINRKLFSIRLARVTIGGTTLCTPYCNAVLNLGSFHIFPPASSRPMINQVLRCQPEEDPCYVECNEVEDLPDLQVVVNGLTIVLTSEDYVRKLRVGAVQVCRTVFKNHDVDYWTLGIPFLNRTYIAYDMENHRIGLAQASGSLSTWSRKNTFGSLLVGLLLLPPRMHQTVFS
ncbi:unnamed protein product [Calicophoron daubneyi]|uniref:Peptidase A1 domain-containing protein n=1 Tax=Calicophoron daubneyi TaxID=300641 RepID=A0AAV2TFD4_CALDB